MKSTDQWYKVPLFFLVDRFLEAKAKILTKNSLFFLVNFKTPKEHFEINQLTRGKNNVVKRHLYIT